MQHRGVAQLGSALRSGRRGRRFKSCHPDQPKGLLGSTTSVPAGPSSSAGSGHCGCTVRRSREQEQARQKGQWHDDDARRLSEQVADPRTSTRRPRSAAPGSARSPGRRGPRRDRRRGRSRPTRHTARRRRSARSGRCAAGRATPVGRAARPGRRSVTWSEVMSRITIYLTVGSAFLVVLVLTVQKTGFGTPFRVMAIGFGPAALVMGTLTAVRVDLASRVFYPTTTTLVSRRLRRSRRPGRPDRRG